MDRTPWARTPCARPCVRLHTWGFLILYVFCTLGKSVAHKCRAVYIRCTHRNAYSMSCTRPYALLRDPTFLIHPYHALKILYSRKMWRRARCFHKSACIFFPCFFILRFWGLFHLSATDLLNQQWQSSNSSWRWLSFLKFIYWELKWTNRNKSILLLEVVAGSPTSCFLCGDLCLWP